MLNIIFSIFFINYILNKIKIYFFIYRNKIETHFLKATTNDHLKYNVDYDTDCEIIYNLFISIITKDNICIH